MELWYKSYSGGRWTWPTPLKSPESKSTEAIAEVDLDLDKGD